VNEIQRQNGIVKETGKKKEFFHQCAMVLSPPQQQSENRIWNFSLFVVVVFK
jgi:hypothetical protein